MVTIILGLYLLYIPRYFFFIQEIHDANQYFFPSQKYSWVNTWVNFLTILRQINYLFT